MVARQPRASLAGFAIALAALIVPLVQLRAPIVAAIVLLASALTVGLLAGLTGVNGRPDAPSVARGGRLPLAFWVPAGLGLAGFAWVLLATGSRQVVEHGPPIERGASFGDGNVVLLQIAADHVVPALVVALLALCSVIAAVLTLVVERPGASAQPPLDAPS
ncbi:hypothetical protein DB30_00136 [Enhygromyxa salina]|uniref:Uncharacterized protein n=2 Tax=Enhygromyxa salina TaxID=215803 RepID=A0A0C2DIX2_9BACT|nr:hypothetical protein DB30_00136 [Enhygromyxa salina]